MWAGHCKNKATLPTVPNGNTIASRFGPGPVVIPNTLANNEQEIPGLPQFPAGSMSRSPRVGDAPAGIWSGAFTTDFMPGAAYRVNGGIKSVNFPTVKRLGVQPRIQVLVPQAVWNTKVQG